MCAAGKNVENELRSIDHFYIGDFTDCARLRGGKGLIENDHVSPLMQRLDEDFLQFPAPQKVSLMLIRSALCYAIDDGNPCRVREFCELSKTFLLLRSAYRRRTHQKRRFAIVLDGILGMGGLHLRLQLTDEPVE